MLAPVMPASPRTNGTFLTNHAAVLVCIDRNPGTRIEDVANEGLFLAPGPSFGPYPSHVRLCYTAVPPDAALRGVDVLARRLAR